MIQKLLFLVGGCFVVAVGIDCLATTHLVTGGTAGLSLAVSYLTNMPFGLLFFLINVPFYILSILRMGFKFTGLTVGCVTLLSLFSTYAKLLPLQIHSILLGSILGGFLIGTGVVLVFLGGGSLGGANILALYLQHRFRINAGVTNFLFDCIAVFLGCIAVGWTKAIYAFLGIIITNVCISQYKNPTLLRRLKAVKVYDTVEVSQSL